MKSTHNQNNHEYQCSICGLRYREKHWAEQCEAWCKTHASCSLAIIRHAISNASPFSLEEKSALKKETKKRGETMEINYGFKKEIDESFEKAVALVKDALQQEGFGVLMEIDVKATLKKKLDVDVDNYVILGACNPSNAFKALQAESDIGLLLPCNVIVYEQEGKTMVSIIKPTVAMQIVENDAIQPIAQTVEEKLHKVFTSL